MNHRRLNWHSRQCWCKMYFCPHQSTRASRLKVTNAYNHSRSLAHILSSYYQCWTMLSTPSLKFSSPGCFFFFFLNLPVFYSSFLLLSSWLFPIWPFSLLWAVPKRLFLLPVIPFLWRASVIRTTRIIPKATSPILWSLPISLLDVYQHF